MRRIISVLLAVLLMASMALSVSAYTVYDVAPTGGDVYVVAGKPAAIFGTEWAGSLEANAMTLDDGKYTKAYTVEEAMKDVQLKVVKNGTEWIGDATGNNVTFDLTGAGTFTVTYDPTTNGVAVTGDIVKFASSFEYEAVYAVGASGTKESFLNGIDWVPSAAENKMTEVSDDVWEIEYTGVEADALQVKFAVDGAWTHNFGIDGNAMTSGFESGVEFDAKYNGDNIAFTTTAEESTVKLRLDLSGFDFATKTGAKITITVTTDDEQPTETPSDTPTEEPTAEPTAEPTDAPTDEPTAEPTDAPTDEPTAEPTDAPTDEPLDGAPTFYVVGSFSEWQTDDAYILTKNAAAEGNEYMLSGVELKNLDEFKVVETNSSILGFEPVWYPNGQDNNYVVTADGTYDIYFRPNYDGGDEWFYNTIYAAAQTPASDPTDEPTDAPTDEPTAEPTGAVEDKYVVAGKPAAIFGTEWAGSLEANAMTLDDGKYTKAYTVEEAMKDVQLKVVKNGTEWIGDATGNNVTFDLTGAGTFTVTYDPTTNGVAVTGDIVKFASSFEYEAVYAVGASGTKESFLNGIDWVPSAAENKMTEVSDDVWEIEYTGVEADALQVKFAVDGAWTHNFGMDANAMASGFESGVEFDAKYNGDNIAFTTTAEESTVKLRLDLSGFDFATKTGAKITVTITAIGESTPDEAPTDAPTDEPMPGAAEYYIVGSMNDWQIDEAFKLTKNTEAEAEEYIFTGLELADDDQFKVVSYNGSIQGGDKVWYPDGMGNNYGQNGEITADGTYTVYFRPNSDGGDDWFYGVIYLALEEVQPTDAPTDAPSDEPTAEPTEAPSDEPTAEPTVEPTEAPTEPPVQGLSFYIVGDITDPVSGRRLSWSSITPLDGNMLLTTVEGPSSSTADDGLYKYENIAIRTEDSFKIVKSSKTGLKASVWYPDGMDNNRTVAEDGIYTIWFRPAGDGTEEDGWEYIYHVGDGSEDPQHHGCTNGGYMYKLEKTGEIPEPEYEIGDVDLDGYITIQDATVIQRALAKLDTLSDKQYALGAACGKEYDTLEITDATMIQRFLAKLERKLGE